MWAEMDGIEVAAGPAYIEYTVFSSYCYGKEEGLHIGRPHSKILQHP